MTRVRALVLGLAALALPAGAAAGSKCTESIQGRIAWDGRTQTNWTNENLEAMCRGAEMSTEPGACFKRITTGGVNWGGGTKWDPANALDLCRGTRNADSTVTCFQAKIAEGVLWRQAVEACRAVPGRAASPAPRVTGPVAAQPRSATKPPSKPDPGPSPITSASGLSRYLASSRSPVKSVSGLDASNRRNQATMTLPGGEASALAAFRLRFENGDHKVKRVSLLRMGDAIQAALNDNDGNDPFAASARYLELNQGRALVATADCRGTCTIPIAVSDGTAALLTGFSFERPQGDHNVRQISVQLLAERGIAEVSLFDDQDRDLRVGSGSLSPARASDARGYLVTLQYLVVDKSMVKRQRRATGDRRNLKGPFAGIDSPSLGGKNVLTVSTAGWSEARRGVPHYALQGFEFRFGNRDHHLREIGVNLDRVDEVVVFQDNNRDDPMSWSVDYAELGS